VVEGGNSRAAVAQHFLAFEEGVAALQPMAVQHVLIAWRHQRPAAEFRARPPRA
jgi:hypothetical protein